MENSISAAYIRSALKTRIIGRRVLYKRATSSTMVIAREEALSGAAEGTVVIAGRQTAGRGRMHRAWVSPPGSLALSVLLYPRPDIIPSLTTMAALAVGRAIKAVTGLETSFKWPNDVLINGKKVSGILAEACAHGDKKYAVIGTGINANNTVAGLGEVSYPATSLSEELGRNVVLMELAVGLLFEMDGLYVLDDRRAIYEEWRDRLETLGRCVSVTSGASVYRGIAESADEDGNLILSLSDGRLVSFAAGDVSVREEGA